LQVFSDIFYDMALIIYRLSRFSLFSTPEFTLQKISIIDFPIMLIFPLFLYGRIPAPVRICI